MTTNVDVVNRALQIIGTRTTVTQNELTSQTSNEAIQANLILTRHRDTLLRMAPWNCGLVYSNLIYLTSIPGTPENTSPSTNLWRPGQPPAPWAYEYMYPDDCLRMCYLIPANLTGFADGVPITTAVTGGAPAFWQGQPIKFKIAVEQYLREATGITVVNGGTGYAVGDILYCGGPPPAGTVPNGLLFAQVASIGGGGVILTVVTTPTLYDLPNLSRNAMLFGHSTYNMSQVYTNGFGTGAVLAASDVGPQYSGRVLQCNQEYASCAYVKQINDPNVMDPDFFEAWAAVVGSGICMALTGDKQGAKKAIQMENEKIAEARKVDGNEGLTINDVTPDFIRIRGIGWTEYYQGPWANFDWGSYWPVY